MTPLRREGAQQDLEYRNKQLRRLKQEILAMEDLDDAPTLSDLTLNHFFAQLLRYLQENQDKLEALPYGVYAVVDGGPGRAPPGAIFFLRQRNAAANREGPAAGGQPGASLVFRLYSGQRANPLRLR